MATLVGRLKHGSNIFSGWKEFASEERRSSKYSQGWHEPRYLESIFMQGTYSSM